MTPRSIFIPLTETEDFRDRLEQAADIALQWEAHLDVVSLAIDHTRSGFAYPADASFALPDGYLEAQEKALDLNKDAAAHLAHRTGLRFASRHATPTLAEVERTIADMSRFSDLVILPKPYADPARPEIESMAEGALFGGAGRLLILPDVSAFVPPKTVLLAWDDSHEAMSAARGALSFLKKADLVKLTLVDPPEHARDRSDPGGAMAGYLARHGVPVEIDVLGKSMPRVSDVLLRHASDIGAGLIVMGAYGHSRFREALIGGATRNMLESCDRPLFLAHV